MKNSLGTLFLVATPIGNLEDFSYRAIKTLKNADYIYCEDTRRTLQLLRNYEITPKNSLESYHDHSPRGILRKFGERLSSGASVAYVTDGGMPAISDPGFVLVRETLQMGMKLECIPGPSAITTFFALSNLESPKFFFHGFFPRTKGEVEKVLAQITDLTVAHVFYEAPNRISSSLEILSRHFPQSQMVVARELTKQFEEWVRGNCKEVYENISAREQVRGEFVFGILGGASKKKQLKSMDNAGVSSSEVPTEEVVQMTESQKEEILTMVRSGVSSKDAAKILSKKFNLSRRIIYEFIIHHLT